jgi:hypothetical protein
MTGMKMLIDCPVGLVEGVDRLVLEDRGQEERGRAVRYPRHR